MSHAIMIFLILALVCAGASTTAHYSFLTQSTHMNREMLFLKDSMAHFTGKFGLLTLDQM